jgi:hypothetical protein
LLILRFCPNHDKVRSTSHLRGKKDPKSLGGSSSCQSNVTPSLAHSLTQTFRDLRQHAGELPKDYRANERGADVASEDLGNPIREPARRELAERKPQEGRQAVEERPAHTGTLRLEMVKCGKERCKKCTKGPAHVPYWCLYYRRNGKLTSRYIGKTDDPEGALARKLA